MGHGNSEEGKSESITLDATQAERINRFLANGRFGKLSDIRMALVGGVPVVVTDKDIFLKGFDREQHPDVVVYCPPPGTGGKTVAMMGWEETVPMTAEDFERAWESLKGDDDYHTVVIDSCATTQEALKALRPPPMPIDPTLEPYLLAEKPHIAMNDWRNNRGGRKNR